MIINKFFSPNGCAELFIAAESGLCDSFKAETSALICELLTAVPAEYHLVWVRFHVSDIANQYADIVNAARDIPAMISVVGQAPLSGAHIAVEAYAVSGAAVEFSEEHDFSEVCFDNYNHTFFNLSTVKSSGSFSQMEEEFSRAEKIISSRGGTLENNLQCAGTCPCRIMCKDSVSNKWPGDFRGLKQRPGCGRDQEQCL